MAPKGTKRAAQGSKGAQPSKVKKVEEVPKQSDPLMEGVVSAIEKSELPDSCKQMLLIIGAGSLKLPAEERHEVQTMAVRMVGEVVEQMHSQMSEEVQEASTAVEAAEAKNSSLAATVVEANSQLEAASETVKGKEGELQEATTSANTKQALFDTAKDAQTKGDTELEAIKQEKQTFVSAFENSFKGLLEADLEGHQAVEHYKIIQPLVAELNLDESLCLALPSTCQKKPCDRGSFGNVIVEQLGKALQTKIAALTEKNEGGASAAAEKAAAVQTAEEELRTANEVKENADKELCNAKTKHEESSEFLQSSKKALADGELQLESLVQTHKDKVSARTQFENWNMTSFTQLKEKSAVPKEVTPPVETAMEISTAAPKEVIVTEASNAPVTEAGA